jgi:hypothetical protein
MLRTIKPVTLSIALAAAAMSTVVAGTQQREADESKPVITAGPVPAPILAAKKVFIANAGVDVDISPDHYSGGIDRAYNQFYAALKSWGHYELVPAPADADLILELQFTAPVGASSVFQGSGGSYPKPRFTLVIKDRKTQVMLWTFFENLGTWETRHLTHDESFDYAIGALVNDMARLAGLPPAIAVEKIKKKADAYADWHPER